MTAATVVPTPNAVPVANGAGKLAAGWIDSSAVPGPFAVANLTPGLSVDIGAAGLLIDNPTAIAWTPALAGHVSGGGTYVTQSGKYIKQGKRILARGEIQLSAVGTISGNIKITDFPFPIDTPGASLTIGYHSDINYGADGFKMMGFSSGINTSVSLYWEHSDGSGNEAMTDTQLGPNTRIMFQLDYETP